MGKRAKREQRKVERQEAIVACEAEHRAQFLAEVAAQRCPKCGSGEVAKIMYGLPRFTAELNAQLDAGVLVLGGCCIWEDAPSWECRSCKYSWDNPVG